MCFSITLNWVLGLSFLSFFFFCKSSKCKNRATLWHNFFPLCSSVNLLRILAFSRNEGKQPHLVVSSSVCQQQQQQQGWLEDRGALGALWLVQWAVVELLRCVFSLLLPLPRRAAEAPCLGPNRCMKSDENELQKRRGAGRDVHRSFRQQDSSSCSALHWLSCKKKRGGSVHSKAARGFFIHTL